MSAVATVVNTESSQELAHPALLPIYRRPDVEFVRGEGVELIDANGKRYLDFVGGIAVNSLGYNDGGIRAALLAALDTGLIHTSNLYRTAPAERLAEALVSRSFADSVFFCNSGAEANEGAFKFARRWGRETGGAAKTGIVALRGSFHGRLFASLAATDRPAYRAPFRPLAGGISIGERSVAELLPHLQGETVCALIVEPVQGEGGVRVLEPGFLKELRDITREKHIALIFDEVQCGLGRTGKTFAYQHSGVVPDMLTLAKPLAGGLPMGAVLMSGEIAAAVKPGDHATTFGGGPLVASVAHHVVERLSDPALLRHVSENGARFGELLQEIAESTGKIRSVRGMGYIWGVDVMEPAAEVVKRAFAAGLLLCTAGDYTIRMLPPLTASMTDLQAGATALRNAITI